jgi:hypothetical protein
MLRIDSLHEDATKMSNTAQKQSPWGSPKFSQSRNCHLSKVVHKGRLETPTLRDAGQRIILGARMQVVMDNLFAPYPPAPPTAEEQQLEQQQKAAVAAKLVWLRVRSVQLV